MGRLIHLEMTALLRERRLILLLVLSACVLAGSGATTLISSARTRRAAEAVSDNERQRWLNQGVQDPHTAAHRSIYAFAPVAPLSALDPGVRPFVGETVWLEAHLQNDLLNRPMQDTRSFERMGEADAAGLFVRFVPMVVFLLALAAAAREADEGTLGLSLSLAGSGWAIAVVKIASVVVLASVATVGPLVIVGLGGLALGGVGGDAVLRLAAWTAAAVAYVLVFAVIGVVLSMHTPSSRLGFSALFAIWLVAVLAALPVGSALAERIRPLPSFQELKLRLERDAPAYWTPEVGAERQARLMARYGVASEAELEAQRVNLRGLELDHAERLAQDVFDREMGGFYRHAVEQDRTFASLAWLSPAVAFHATSTALAGTNFQHHLMFIDAAETYRRALVNRMNADLLPNPTRNGVVHTNDAGLWSQVPAFAFKLPGWRLALREAGHPLAALGLWLVASVAIGAGSTSRLRP